MHDLLSQINKVETSLEKQKAQEIPISGSSATIALQATSPGTAQTGHGNVAGDLRAGGDLYAGDDVIATDTVQGAIVNATSKVQLNGVTVLENGTSFPGSPSAGQRYFRTDRVIEYYYDGTRWLSTNKYTLSFSSRDSQVFTQASHVFGTEFEDYDYNGIYIHNIRQGFNPNTAQNSTNYYTLAVFLASSSTGNFTVTGLTGLTDTKIFVTTGKWWAMNTIVNQPFNNTYFHIETQLSPTLNPGQFNYYATVSYRVIG